MFGMVSESLISKMNNGLTNLQNGLKGAESRYTILQERDKQAQTALDNQKATQSKNTTAQATSSPISGFNKDESLLINEAKNQGASNTQIAYILGTAKHESDNFNTMTEYASGSDYEGRQDLGNTQAGDGTKYKGAGYVQITGRNNYDKYSKLTGLDLIGNPNLAKDPKTSAFITVNGILNGGFTGVKLSNYVNDNKTDFINARRTVNGTDKAQLIANYANDYLKKLK